tara:strand:+ start:219 stop:1241 length:1023 start_codon:yes stop_codon:yes gene_type:complete
MAAPNSVISTTLQLLKDKLVDQSFTSLPLFKAIEAAGNLKMVSGGMRVEAPVMFGEHSTITEYTNGYEPTSMVFTDPYQTAKFEWCNFSEPIGLSKVERSANKGSLAIVNILDTKMKNAMNALKKEVNRTILQGPIYTTSRLSQLQTLNGMTTAASTGWLEGVVQASQQNVIGTLSKVTYQSKNWFNQFKDCAASFDLADLDELIINCSLYNASGSTPDIIIMSPKCYAKFQALQTAIKSPGNAKDLRDINDTYLTTYMGAKVYVDLNMGFTAQNPAKPVSAYVLNSRDFEIYADQDGWFDIGEMAPLGGTILDTAQIFCRMQLVTSHLASHGVLLDAEA